MAFAHLEPFGFDAELYGHALTTSTIANVNRPKGKSAYSPLDFMPKEKVKPDASTFFKELKSFLFKEK